MGLVMNSNFFLGVIEDRNDPEKMGRVRVRVMGLHDDDRKINIPIEKMPWASVMQPCNASTCASNLSQLVEGTWVVVTFFDATYQDPIVLGSIPSSNKDYPNYSKGFSDPFGVHPRWAEEESDISLVAREDEWKKHPTYQKRDEQRVIEIPIAKKHTVGSASSHSTTEPIETWDEREVRNEQDSTYPYNSVREYEAGHIEEYDSTHDNTRITKAHRSGTYEEIVDDGSRTVKIVSDDYELVIEDKNIYIKGDLNVTVEGNKRELIKGDYILEVAGNYHETIGKSRATKIFNSDSLEVDVSQSVNIGNFQSFRCGGNQTTQIVGWQDVHIGLHQVELFGTYQTTTAAGGDITISASPNIWLN